MAKKIRSSRSSNAPVFPPDFLKKIQQLFSADALLSDAEATEPYASDWTRTPGDANLVALPKSPAEVAACVRLCHEFAVPVVPSGGRTGLAGGAVARAGQLVLSTGRLKQIGAVDPISRSVRVQAGVVTQTVHETCAREGLTWPIDLASKGSCTVGGNLSTNAGGLRVVRYGMARKWVTALQVVSAAGEIIDLNNGLEKNNTGYDLLQLFIGSEGTLGIITEATLKLTASPGETAVLLLGAKSLPALVEIFAQARRGPFQINACEFFSDRCLQVVQRKLGRRSGLQQSHPYYLLIELELSQHPHAKDHVANWLELQMGRGLFSDGYMAESSEAVREVWQLREGITESLQMSGLVRKYDVAVPVRKLPQFLAEAIEVHRELKPSFELYLFGHLGDGSPHLNLLKNAEVAEEKFLADWQQFEKRLYPLLTKHQGSISAEHGIGCLKRDWLSYSRTAVELQWLRAIKNSFDPKGILNPGKLL